MICIEKVIHSKYDYIGDIILDLLMHDSLVLFISFITVFSFSALSSLCFYHLYLIAKGLTTNEDIQLHMHKLSDISAGIEGNGVLNNTNKSNNNSNNTTNMNRNTSTSSVIRNSRLYDNENTALTTTNVVSYSSLPIVEPTSSLSTTRTTEQTAEPSHETGLHSCSMTCMHVCGRFYHICCTPLPTSKLSDLTMQVSSEEYIKSLSSV